MITIKVDQGEFVLPAPRRRPRPAPPDIPDVGEDVHALTRIAMQGKAAGFGGIELRS